MKIYQISTVEGFVELQLKNYKEEKLKLKESDATYALKDKWEKIQVEIITKGKKSDCPYFWADSDIIIISKKAAETLASFWIQNDIELLPIDVNQEAYYIVHLMHLSDIVFDYQFTLKGEMFSFSIEELIKTNVNSKGIFRAYRGGEGDKKIFFTEEFVEAIKATDLKGFNFKVVWDSEKTNEKRTSNV